MNYLILISAGTCTAFLLWDKVKRACFSVARTFTKVTSKWYWIQRKDENDEYLWVA